MKFPGRHSGPNIKEGKVPLLQHQLNRSLVSISTWESFLFLFLFLFIPVLCTKVELFVSIIIIVEVLSWQLPFSDPPSCDLLYMCFL